MVAVMKAVPFLYVRRGGTGEERLGVEEAVSRVEHPDGEEHGEGVQRADVDPGAPCEKVGPGGSPGGRVE